MEWFQAFTILSENKHPFTPIFMFGYSILLMKYLFGC